MEFSPDNRAGTKAESSSAQTNDGSNAKAKWGMLVVAAALLLAVGASFAWNRFPNPSVVAESTMDASNAKPLESLPLESLGFVMDSDGCIWAERPISGAAESGSNRLIAGIYELTSGVAELQLDSGALLMAESPCRFRIGSPQFVQLVSGTMFVSVTDSVDAFELQTRESRISDCGTEYAVSVTETSCEVHVFDGAVVWETGTQLSSVTKPDVEPSDQAKIESGQAMRYEFGQARAKRFVPFGIRKEAQQVDLLVQQAGGDGLLAFEGFEYLAGRIRRGRSGFGWSGGWLPAGVRPRWGSVDIVSHPTLNREDGSRRQLSLGENDDLRRTLDKPIALASDASVFVSMWVSRQDGDSILKATGKAASSLNVSFEPDPPQRRRIRPIPSFKLSSAD